MPRHKVGLPQGHRSPSIFRGGVPRIIPSRQITRKFPEISRGIPRSFQRHVKETTRSGSVHTQRNMCSDHPPSRGHPRSNPQCRARSSPRSDLCPGEIPWIMPGLHQELLRRRRLSRTHTVIALRLAEICTGPKTCLILSLASDLSLRVGPLSKPMVEAISGATLAKAQTSNISRALPVLPQKTVGKRRALTGGVFATPPNDSSKHDLESILDIALSLSRNAESLESRSQASQGSPEAMPIRPTGFPCFPKKSRDTPQDPLRVAYNPEARSTILQHLRRPSGTPGTSKNQRVLLISC